MFLYFITQSHRHVGVPMFIDTTQRQRFGVTAIIPTLALLMLLGAGCSEKEATAPEEDEPQAATEPNVSRSAHMTSEAVKAFVPTHTVRARLNLRPSTSLNTTPITVLKVGSEVEYIKEADGWYYVNTQLHGKGWCSSEHLSSLSPPKNK